MKEANNKDIKKLAHEAKNYNKKALSKLLEREKLICEAYFSKQNLPKSDVQDMAQNVLMKIAKNIGGLKESKTYPKWAKTIAKNELCDYLRARKRSSANVNKNDDFQEISKNVADKSLNPLDGIIQKEIKECIKKSVNFLPREYKLAIIMRDIAGLSYARIAQVSNLNLGTVKSRISRAREKLKKIVEPYLDDDLK